MTVEFCGGIPICRVNQITRREPEFYISYNPSQRDYGTDTTAMHINETGQFLTLAGNHTDQYNGLNFTEALAYFYANVDKAVPQSEHGRVFKFENGKAAYVAGGY